MKIRNLKQKKILCACGCGKTLNYLDKYGRPRKFIHGHNKTFGMRGKISPQRNGKYKNCLICGKEFYVKKSRLKTAKYCSTNCYDESLKGTIPWNKDKICSQLSGKNNGAWRGGIHKPYPPEFDISFKNKIRKRDNQICMLCGAHREKFKKALDVHHINYDKKLTIPQNCITLCHNCHAKTNWNRKSWILFFQSMLSKKYGYQYSESGKIILEVINEK